MTYETLSFDVSDRVALITFATPKRLNSISESRLTELEAVLTDLEAAGGVRGLILTGEGERAFCVGLDLDLLDRAFADLAYFETVVRRVAGIIARIEALPIPTLAAVNGLTRAGGFEFCLGCDFIVMAEEARIGDGHTDSGVLPAASTTRLKRKIGDQRAKALIWSARYLTGREAVEQGLAIMTVPRSRLVEDSTALMRSMIDKPRALIAASKATFQIAPDTSGVAAAEIELANFMRYMRAHRYGEEGYRAFREGRPPSWRVDADATG